MSAKSSSGQAFPLERPSRGEEAGPSELNVSFSVPFTHRVRFTNDVLGADDQTLIDVLEPSAGRSRVLAVIDRGVDTATNAAEHLRALAIRHGHSIEMIDICLLEGGEAIKNDPRHLQPLFERIHSDGLDRRSYILAIGGGAFLDAVGFAAALSHRGLRLVRLPTTVMGQADSGIGVKNAINFFGKKNWLGTFAVPWAVINDQMLLSSLPTREYRCGFSEAVKVSLLKDPAFFDRLCADAKAIAQRDTKAADFAIRRSAILHLKHITQGGDPFEAQEARPLDFGHWAAHQIEAMTDFSVRHGEAVAMGLAIDCTYSVLKHGLPQTQADRILQCLRDLGLSLQHACLTNADVLLNGLEEFRQHLGGQLTVTMLADVGRPIDVHEIDLQTMRHAIERVGIE